jgi:hypothetical protein
MTDGLVAAVAVVSVLTLLNLLLTYGVIRRLRDHEERLSRAGTPSMVDLPIGAPVPPFRADTTDGGTVTSESLAAGAAYAAFFSPTCPPCREQMPLFVDAVADARRDRILIVVSRDGADPTALADFVAAIGPAGHVVVEDTTGPVAGAFGVSGQPTLLRFNGGELAARAHTVEELFAPLRA